ncbi:hypothetical protein [Sphingobacterium luzhongxinii]|uniref:hypothetical protein n=1 Tax=Sphingobacterium luzhongxinii TaxID=2654181 RepID=UPI0013D9D45A|nr:hypothetical protein [Sphingobacterium sp. xlx-73]
MIKEQLNINQFIFDLENKYDLYNWVIDDIYVWELIRAEVYIKAQEYLSGESFGKEISVPLFRKMNGLISRLFESFTKRNIFLICSKPDVFIFESGRKYLVDNNYVDMYSYFIAQKHLSNNETVISIETNYNNDSIYNKSCKSFNNDSIKILSRLFSLFFFIQLSSRDLELIKKLEEDLINILGFPVKLFDLIKKNIKKFVGEKRSYELLLRIYSPKVIYYVNYLEYPALIEVAKRKGIKTIELQHGLIIKEALFYHFPNVNNNKLRYFSDEFYCWKDFKFNSGLLPLSKNQIILNDYNHLKYMKEKYSEIKKNDKAILIASQPFKSLKILTFILHNAPKMQDFVFYYKVHPMESNTFFLSEESRRLQELDNVIIYDNNVSAYELLSMSSYTLGIYSTLLFEAHYFGSIPMMLVDDSVFSESLINNSSCISIEPTIELKVQI